jgi:hypothetical protein
MLIALRVSDSAPAVVLADETDVVRPVSSVADGARRSPDGTDGQGVIPS